MTGLVNLLRALSLQEFTDLLLDSGLLTCFALDHFNSHSNAEILKKLGMAFSERTLNFRDLMELLFKPGSVHTGGSYFGQYLFKLRFLSEDASGEDGCRAIGMALIHLLKLAAKCPSGEADILFAYIRKVKVTKLNWDQGAEMKSTEFSKQVKTVTKDIESKGWGDRNLHTFAGSILPVLRQYKELLEAVFTKISSSSENELERLIERTEKATSKLEKLIGQTGVNERTGPIGETVKRADTASVDSFSPAHQSHRLPIEELLTNAHLELDNVQDLLNTTYLRVLSHTDPNSSDKEALTIEERLQNMSKEHEALKSKVEELERLANHEPTAIL